MPGLDLVKPMGEKAGLAAALGLGVGVALPVVLHILWVIIRNIRAWPSQHKPRVEAKFDSFTTSYRFQSDEEIVLPFTFIPRKIQRRDALKEIIQRLSKGRGGRVVIWEEGGAGKTALAAAAVCKMNPKLSGGSLWLSVDNRDLSSFLRELAILLNCLGAQDLGAVVRVQLAALGPCLLAVDNLDTAHEEVVSFLEKEVPSNCRVLTTTRHRQMQERLGNPLSLRPTDQEAREFGRKFLQQRAKERNTPLLPETEAAILGAAPLGNPKVIETLLGDVEALGLEGPIREIRSGRGSALEDVIGRSINPLGIEVRRVLYALSLFVPVTSRVSLAAVTEIGELDSCLEQLWTRRLAEHDREGQHWWVSNHVRDYARACPETDELRPSYARYFLKLAVEITNSEFRSTVNPALDEQRENLFNAMSWCVLRMKKEDEHQKEAAKLLTEYLRVLHLFFYDAGYWQELQRYAEEGMQVAAPLLNDKSITSDMAYILAMTYDNRSLYLESEKLYHESLDLKRDLGDNKGIADVLYQLGRLTQERMGSFVQLTFESSLSKAEEMFQECLSLSQDVGDTRLSAFAYHRLGMVARSRRANEQAKLFFNEGLRLAKEARDGRGEAYNMDQLGALAHREGDLEKAQWFYERSRELKEEVMHERATTYTLDQLGVLAHDKGKQAYKESNRKGAKRLFNEAEKLFSESLTLQRKLGDNPGIAYTLHRKGMLAREQNDVVKAEQFYKDSLAIRRKLEDKKGIAETLIEIAKLRDQKGTLQEATALLQEALGLFQEAEYANGEKFVEHYLIQMQEAQLSKKS